MYHIYDTQGNLGMFKGSTDLDEISGCTLPIELRPWMERFLDDCMNSK